MERYRTLTMDSARWAGFEHRPGDIVISTPAKCGTTWTQMLVALMVFDGPDLPAPLDLLSPWLDMCNRTVDDVRGDLDAQTHRRFVKTHTPLDGLPLRRDVTYVVVGRDPRDVTVSMEHHRHNMDLDHFMELRTEVMGLDDLAELPRPGPAASVDDRMAAFLHGDDFGSLASIVHHLDDAWVQRHSFDVVLMHYADLTTDLPGEMVRLAGALGIPMSPERARARLAPHASLTAMRSRAGELAPVVSHQNWKDPDAFFRRGAMGEGRAAMSAAHHAEYDDRMRALAEPRLAAWIAAGRIASGVEPTG